MTISWVRSLQINAKKLDDLANFYSSHGFEIAATLLAAAAIEIRENADSGGPFGIRARAPAE